LFLKSLRYIDGMQRWRKVTHFWVWIMVLVMPLAGLAQSTVPCVASHAPLRTQSLPEPFAGAPCHGGAVLAMADAASEGVTSDAATGGDNGHRCSVCAACVAGAALPATALVLSAPAAGMARSLPPLLQGAGVLLGRLERPPRSAR